MGRRLLGRSSDRERIGTALPNLRLCGAYYQNLPLPPDYKKKKSAGATYLLSGLTSHTDR